VLPMTHISFRDGPLGLVLRPDPVSRRPRAYARPYVDIKPSAERDTPHHESDPLTHFVRERIPISRA
jgi:hypothetical protein